MRKALIEGEELRCPAVGRWEPVVGLGAPIQEGLLLGHLVRVGRRLAVVAPAGVAGAAMDLAPSGVWCQHGDALMCLGDGGAVAQVEVAVPESADAPAGAVAIRAETDGTLYLRPDPGSPCFVEEGRAVTAQTTVALVEVMKTFTALRAPFDGVVVRVDGQDAGSVEGGQAIVWMRPSA